MLLFAAIIFLSSSAPQANSPSSQDLVREEESRRIETIQRIAPAAVCLFPKDVQAGGGSGVLIDPEGCGVTNFHVIAACLPQRVATAGLPDGRKLDVEILGLDPHGDLAMFRILDDKPLPAATLGNSDKLSVGDPCLAVGNPFLLAEDYTPTVTFGIISGLHRYQWGTGRALSYTDCIQVDTSINPGNSGGPLFDLGGQLIGINGRVSIEERGRVNVGVGYAIPINQVRRFIPALRAGLVTPHATAGFTVTDHDGRVVVNQVREGAAAWRAGVRLGDRVVQFAGQPVTSANRFASQLGTYPANWPVELVYARNTDPLVARFRLETLPLPDLGRPVPDSKKPRPDPFADNALTKKANRRAVERALRRYAVVLGGAKSMRAVARCEGRLIRWMAADGFQKAESGTFRENFDDSEPPRHDNAVEIERAIRRELWRDAGESDAPRGRVVRGDEIDGRITVVIERTVNTTAPVDKDSEQSADKRLKCELSLDDETGDLLAVEFEMDSLGRSVRYEYDDIRPCGPLHLPHRRTIYLDGRLHAREVLDGLTLHGDVE